MNRNIVRRLRLNRVMYPFLLHSVKNSDELPSYAESIRILKEEYPDHENSCFLNRTMSPLEKHVVCDIIIPAYNMEKHIVECLESVLRQKTDFTFRLIVVDDGATDRTGAILDSYKGDSRVAVIHQSNKGQAGARNAGLRISNSDYILFLDSDDRLAPGALNKLLKTALRTGADVVAGSYYNFVTGKRGKHIHRQKKKEIHSINGLTGHPCFKVYRSQLFSEIGFPEGYWFEDSVIHQIILPRAHSMRGISDVVYERRTTPGSITQSQEGNPKSIDTVWVTLSLLKDRKKLGLTADSDLLDYMLTMVVLSQHRLQNHRRQIQLAAFRIYQEILNTECRNLHTSYAKRRTLECALREGNFEKFLLYCKYH